MSEVTATPSSITFLSMPSGKIEKYPYESWLAAIERRKDVDATGQLTFTIRLELFVNEVSERLCKGVGSIGPMPRGLLKIDERIIRAVSRQMASLSPSDETPGLRDYKIAGARDKKNWIIVTVQRHAAELVSGRPVIASASEETAPYKSPVEEDFT
ncbi:MAG: hypothetical protein HY860_00175 [Chlamydiales bacterium]|nr:hypothetical protein [Chlamydiales bacterium]